MIRVVVWFLPCIRNQHHLPRSRGSLPLACIFVTIEFTPMIAVPPYCERCANGSRILYPYTILLSLNHVLTLSHSLSSDGKSLQQTPVSAIPIKSTPIFFIHSSKWTIFSESLDCPRLLTFPKRIRTASLLLFCTLSPQYVFLPSRWFWSGFRPIVACPCLSTHRRRGAVHVLTIIGGGLTPCGVGFLFRWSRCWGCKVLAGIWCVIGWCYG